MVVKRHGADIAILGAGIMGCCLALELAGRGRRVELIDLAPKPMMGASLHNEGKLHLGFVYAKDPLKKTHGMMLRGSLAFSRILEKLTGCGADSLMPSRPFHYFVPLDSQLDMDAIEDHFEQVEASIHEETRSTGNLYMGRRIDRYHERTRSIHHNRVFAPDFTLGSFKTEEISASPVTLAAILRRAIDSHPAIDFIGNTEVLAADRLATGDVEVEFLLDGKTSKKRYPSVANCLWDDKLRVDRTAGIRDLGPWILRYKATVNFSAPSAMHGDIPSATGILGSYGDVVNHNNGSYYVSWYPLTRIAQSVDGHGRRLHDVVHKGIVSRCIRKVAPRDSSISKFVASIAHEKFIDDNIREMAAFIPSMATLVNRKRHCEIGGGVILARGATDIDDPASDLHRRDEIGPVAHGSYVTIDTGKYCMAPLFALQAADMITDALN